MLLLTIFLRFFFFLVSSFFFMYFDFRVYLFLCLFNPFLLTNPATRV